MSKMAKTAAVVALLLIALSAVVIAYAGSRNNSKANDDQQANIQDMQGLMQRYFNSNGTVPPGQMMIPPGQLKHMMENECNGRPLINRFLQNATAATVQGTVVTEFKGMLILDTNTSQVRILLPKNWAVNSEVVNRTTLFNSTFATTGSNITIKVLESNIFNNTSFTINVMMGYEAINATNTHAAAVLPFNIQTP
jgi:type II secretory pathway pseudopilin PulG